MIQQGGKGGGDNETAWRVAVWTKQARARERGGRGGAINGDSVKIWARACIRFTCACMRGGVHGMCVSVR